MIGDPSKGVSTVWLRRTACRVPATKTYLYRSCRTVRSLLKPRVGFQVVGDVEQAVLDALDAGYRHIDTALLYETEGDVGRAIRAKIAEGVVKREEAFVCTKVRTPPLLFDVSGQQRPICAAAPIQIGLCRPDTSCFSLRVITRANCTPSLSQPLDASRQQRPICTGVAAQLGHC